MANSPGPYNPSTSQLDQSQFDRLGIPGKYHSAVTVATATSQSFTGSHYGYGAFMLGAGAKDVATKIFIVGGGVLAGPDLAEQTIYDIAPAAVQSTGGNIFVFKRQQ